METKVFQFEVIINVLVSSFLFIRIPMLLINGHYDILKVIYHHLYSMNNFVTNKSKLTQDGAQLLPYMG